MRPFLLLTFFLCGSKADATLILVMNTRDGVVVCADNRVRRAGADSDNHHKIQVAKNGIVMTMSGTASVELATIPPQLIYSFYDETISFLNRYTTPEAVMWNELGPYLQTGFTNKVIGTLGGVPPWLREFEVPGFKMIDELRFFFHGQDGHFYHSLALVDYRETEGRGSITASYFPPSPLSSERTNIMVFGRGDIFNRIFLTPYKAFELAAQQQTLNDMIIYTAKTKLAGLDYFADGLHATEALRYLIYITSILGPDLVVSPTSDCGVLKSNGAFDLKEYLPAMIPDHLAFSTKSVDVVRK